MNLQLFLTVTLLFSCSDAIRFLNIGVLVDGGAKIVTYFNFAVNHTNSQLERAGSEYRLRPLFKRIREINNVHRAVCALSEYRDDQTEPGVIAVFAPTEQVSASVAQNFGDHFAIPVFHYHNAYQVERDEGRGSMYISVYPHFTAMNNLISDTVDFYNWTAYGLLFQDEESFKRLESLVRDRAGGQRSFRAWRIGDNNYMDNLKQLRRTSFRKVVVASAERDIKGFLRNLQKLQLLTEKHHYIIDNLHLGDFELTEYMYGGMNFTAFRVLDYDSLEYHKMSNKFIWEAVDSNYLKSNPNHNANRPISLELALILDAIHMLELGLTSASGAAGIKTASISCYREEQWDQGHTLLNFIHLASVKAEGLTGSLALNGFGQREKLSVNILERNELDLHIVGNWSAARGANISIKDSGADPVGLLNNTTLIVTTIIQPPFTMEVEGEEALAGNDRYHGYCVDLLEEVRRCLVQDGIQFKYAIQLVKDGFYGSRQPNGSWNGMVGELQSGVADLAVAPLTINYERQEFIDFTTPYMNLGISILFRRRENRTPSLFSFLHPLHMDIWMYLIVSYLFISLVLYLLSRFTPLETEAQCEDPSVQKLNLANSLWFAAGAMMQQGSEIIPIALSTKIVAAVWLVFAWLAWTVYLAGYTSMAVSGALAPTLEAHLLEHIYHGKPLIVQSDGPSVSYGTLSDSATQEFFAKSQIPTYVRMYQFMERMKDSVFVSTTEEGIKRVEEEDYAFLMESSMIQYITSQRCNLTQVGGLLDSKFYGIGLRKGSPYTHIMSKAILQLQDEGVLVKLKKKWWEERSQCVESSGSGEDASALELDSIGGIFYLLVCGTSVGLVTALFEFCWKIRKDARQKQHSVGTEAKNFLSEAFGDGLFIELAEGSPPHSPKRVVHEGDLSKATVFANETIERPSLAPTRASFPRASMPPNGSSAPPPATRLRFAPDVLRQSYPEHLTDVGFQPGFQIGSSGGGGSHNRNIRFKTDTDV